MSFRNRPFDRFSHFDPESRLSDFRKRFEDLTQKPNNMFIDSKLGNRWPDATDGHTMSNSKRTDTEDEGIPIKVIHEKSDDRRANDSNDDKNSDSMSSLGSTRSHRSSDRSGSSHSSGSVFHSNRSPNTSDSASASAQPRVHHIPITVEPRDGSTSSGYTSENTATNEQPLSRSTSQSSAHSAGSSGQLRGEKRSPSPAKSGSSEPNGSKPRVIPIKVESNQKSSSPSNDNNLSKVKTNGLTQSAQPKGKPTKPKSGPFVTRIPVVGQTESTQDDRSESDMNSSSELNVKSKPNPLELISKVLTDLNKYETEVNQFEGTADDKRYRYLDEMLTRCMIKLDTIETNGEEEVRKARKAAVIAVNKCIALLDSKVLDKNQSKVNISCEQSDQPMEVSTPEPSEQQKATEEQMDSSGSQVKTVSNEEQNDCKTEDKNCNENSVENESSNSTPNTERKETAV